jgi:O-antigen ligase
LVIARARAVAVVAAGSFVLFGAGLITAGAAERFATVERDAGIRLHLFGTAFGVFRDHPWLGVGHGLYRKVVAPTYDGKGALLDAHNMVLQVLAETGLVGFTGWAFAVGASFYLVLRRVHKDRDSSDERALLDRVALFGLTAYLVLGLTHVPTHHAPVAMLFWVLLGIAAPVKKPA